MSVSHDAVPASLRTLLGQLAAARVTRGFYLAGGTGLALRLNHRRSVDLDFFSRTNRLDAAGRRALLAALRPFPSWKTLEAKNETVHGLTGRVRVSFFWYPQPLVKPLSQIASTRVASLEDIGVMKIAAIIGRGSRKDFVDLYAICQRIPLTRLLALGQRKFAQVRDFRWQALKALNFFTDAEQEPIVVMIQPVSWGQITAFFSREVRRLAHPFLRRSL